MNSPSQPLALKPHVNVILLPHACPDQKAESETSLRLRHFRLESLRLAPEAFASSYERENQFAEDVWRQRLEDPRAQHIVAVLGTARDYDMDSGRASEPWKGMIVVLHRSSTADVEPATSPWETASSQTSMISAASYHLNGFFVHPSARRVGLGQRLVQAALRHTRGAAALEGLPSAKVTVIVDPSNQAALAVYEKCGFVTVKESPYQVGEGPPRTARTMIQEIAVQEERT
ncbi:MAG: gnat family [Lasallia pustulata]|uniref:Gnat family n=1 Tax=Lasallia pustulata TaxID=136370 RepID=A0A5M8PMZ8_9LECA|nr:MAG: gnat family [Lasallia pustulata]